MPPTTVVPPTLSQREVQEQLGIESQFIVQLKKERIVSTNEDGRFTQVDIERIRVCHTLHHELGVNIAGIEVALRLLEIIDAERRQFGDVLQWLKSQMGR